MPRPLFTSGKDLVPIVQEAGWAPGPVWTDAENLALTGIQSPDRPACSKSLYQLCYPAHIYIQSVLFIVSLTTAVPSNREPVSIRTSCDRCHAQAHDHIKMYDVEGTCIMHGKQWHIYKNLSQKV